MKYRGIFEYEYPTEHKPPVSIDVYLHGDCVKGKIIEWEYRPLEQEPHIKALGEELRKVRKGIKNEKVLIGFNMAVAICNKHLGESEDKE